MRSGVDVCIIDTAGRLQTQTNLMQELEKIRRVIGKQIPEAPHETLLVLDATAGQNGLSQAQGFYRRRQMHRHRAGQVRRHGQGRRGDPHPPAVQLAGEVRRHRREGGRPGAVQRERLRGCPVRRRAVNKGSLFQNSSKVVRDVVEIFSPFRTPNPTLDLGAFAVFSGLKCVWDLRPPRARSETNSIGSWTPKIAALAEESTPQSTALWTARFPYFANHEIKAVYFPLREHHIGPAQIGAPLRQSRQHFPPATGSRHA